MHSRLKYVSRKPKNYFGLVIPVLAAFFVSSLFAQPIMRWDSAGVSLRQGHRIEWFADGAQDPVSGDMVVVWSDCRYGDRDIFAQKIDLSGNPLWEEDGKLICQAIGRQLDPEVIYSENGNWIIAWVDYRWNPNWIEAGDVYVQKVNSSGEPLWNPDGVAVCLATGVQQNLRMAPDGSGGVIIVWEDNRSGDGNDVYAQHVMSDGQVDPDWLLNGSPVISYLGRQEEITVDTDGNGGAIVAWLDTRLSSNYNIYAQRITPQGTLLWNATGQPICTYNYDQYNPELCSDGQGGAFIVWLDMRLDPNFGDIFFQRVNSDGIILLRPNGEELCTASMEQNYCRVITSGDGGAIFCWEDFRNDEQNTISDIYAQKVNASGNALWGFNGMVVCDANEEQYYPQLVSDGGGGAIIGWVDNRNVFTCDDADIYTQKISSSGTPVWLQNGVVVCDADGCQNYVLLKSDNNHGAFFFWGSGYGWFYISGIFEQHLNASGVPLLQQNGVPIHLGITGAALYPKMVETIPGQVMVAWEDNRFGQSKCLFVQLVDTSGNYLLEPDGHPIGVESLNGNMDTPQLASDLQNGGLLVWKEVREPNLFDQIYAQRIDPSGNTLWTVGGVHIYSIEAGQQNPFIVGDGTGGAFVVWSGNTINYNLHVYAQRLSASGSQVWNQPVEITHSVETDDECYSAVPDNEGGVIITWRAGPWPDFYVLAQKLDQNGNELWQSGGIRLSNTNGEQSQPVVIADGNGGGVFAWRDKRDLEYYNLYAQRIDGYGNLVWSDSGLSVCNVPSDKQDAKLALDCDGNVFVVWQDFRSGQHLDLYLQKITPTGELVFPASGLPVCILENDQQYPQMVSDTGDGVYITWQGYTLTGSCADIFSTHINGAGEMPGPEGLWQENGNVVCEAIMWQLYPAIAPDGGGGSIISWQDNRALSRVDDWTYNIFAQRMNDGTVISAVKGGVVSLPTEFRLEQNYPNPFNPTTRINYSLAQGRQVNLVIYDILGRKVRTLQNQFMTAGSHLIIWNGVASSGDPVASGTYFYKLEANNRSITRKMVLLK